MLSLDALLEFHTARGPSTVPPRGAHVAVSDTVDSPTTFVLLHYLLVALQDDHRVVWVDASGNNRTHLLSLARKSVRSC